MHKTQGEVAESTAGVGGSAFTLWLGSSQLARFVFEGPRRQSLKPGKGLFRAHIKPQREAVLEQLASVCPAGSRSRVFCPQLAVVGAPALRPRCLRSREWPRPPVGRRGGGAEDGRRTKRSGSLTVLGWETHAQSVRRGELSGQELAPRLPPVPKKWAWPTLGPRRPFFFAIGSSAFCASV